MIQPISAVAEGRPAEGPAASLPSAADFGRLAAALRAADFRGDIDGDIASRAAVSTDNSVYRLVPDLVVAPRDAEDVARLVRTVARPGFASIPITARGGGTGTNGQSLNSGVIVDFRRHMHRLIAFDAEEGWADVEPGIVLDDLNATIASAGLFFAPNTSTSNRCTIGGMVSTDASGKGSRIFGKTSDNVLGLAVVTGDGIILDSMSSPGAAAGPVLAEAAAACAAGRDALLATVPHLSRRFSGYDLERALPRPGQLEWWRLFIGAEGTLGLVTKVRVRLRPRLRFNRLFVVAFRSFDTALAATPRLVAFDPLAVECLDEWVQRLAAREGLLDDLPPSLRRHDDDPIVYDFVEFAGDDEALLERQLEMLASEVGRLEGYVGHHRARDAAEIARLWAVRAAAVGLLGRSDSRRTPIAFVEDCVVPPEELPDFVRGFAAVLGREGLAYGIYGHADVGCLHVRPALDIDDPRDRERLKRVSDAVYALVKHHGGIFWGEHGKGVRGEYLRDFVGPVAYEAFRRIKRAFDPDERYNPGKLVGIDKAVRGISSTPLRPRRVEPSDPFADAFACNGNAACLSFERSIAMCPSFKATGDVRHSPKGRSEALKAWHAAEDGDRASLDAATFDLLDGCLGCNACTRTCPAHVNIPEMKSRFLADYHRRNTRKAAERAAVALERFAPQLARLRPLVRLVHRMGLQEALSRRLGLCDTPAVSRAGLRRLGYAVVGPRRAARRLWPANGVLVATDAFTTLFDTPAIRDVCAGLEALGYAPAVLDLPPGGKAAHVKGDRADFLAAARHLDAALATATTAAIPIVGVDPAFVMMLRQEYADAGFAAAGRVQLVQEFLVASMRAGKQWPSASPRAAPATIFLHCAEAAGSGAAARDWLAVFAKLGLAAAVAKTGCCGMAGLYGHEARHQEMSRRIFDLSWAEPAASEPTIFATGFSCRCQSERFTGMPARHPLALVSAAIAAAPRE